MPEPKSILGGLERRRIERAASDNLDPQSECRRKFILRWDDGADDQSIAAELGLSVKTIRIWKQVVLKSAETDEHAASAFIHAPRVPGRPPVVRQLLAEKLRSIPAGELNGSLGLSKKTGIPARTIRRYFATLRGVKPKHQPSRSQPA